VSTTTSTLADRAARRFGQLAGFPDLAAFAPVAEAAVRCYIAATREILESVACGEGRDRARAAEPALGAFAAELEGLVAGGARLLPGEAHAVGGFRRGTPGSPSALARVALLGCGYRPCPRCGEVVWDMGGHRCSIWVPTDLDEQLPALSAYQELADGALLAHYSDFASALTGRRCTVRFGPGGGGAYTDMAGNVVVDPSPVGAVSPTERLIGILGDIVHEVGHERHTPAMHWAEVVALSRATAPTPRAATVPGRGTLTVIVPPGAAVHTVYNIIEDGRMERCLVAEEPGAAALLAASCRLLDRYPQSRPEDWSGHRVPPARADRERVAVLGALLYAALPYYLLPALTVAAWPSPLFAQLAECLPLVAAAVRGTPEMSRDTAIWLACRLHAAGHTPDGLAPDRKPSGAPRGYATPPARQGQPDRQARSGQPGAPSRGGAEPGGESDEPGPSGEQGNPARQGQPGTGGAEGSPAPDAGDLGGRRGQPDAPGQSDPSGRAGTSGEQDPEGQEESAQADDGGDGGDGRGPDRDTVRDDDRGATPSGGGGAGGEVEDAPRRPDGANPAPFDTVLAGIIGEAVATLAPLVRWSRSPAGSRRRLHRPLPQEPQERLDVRLPGAWDEQRIVEYPRGGRDNDDLRTQVRPFSQRLALHLEGIRRTDWRPTGHQESGTFDMGRLLPALLDEPAVFRRLVQRPVTRFAVSILLDESGSMELHRRSGALARSVLTLALALEALEMPYEVRLFSGGTAAVKHFDDRHLVPERAAAVSTWGGGGTILTPTARLAITSLLGRDEEQRLLITLTDGALGHRDREPAEAALRHARQRGIVTFGVFLGDPGPATGDMATLFGSWVAVGDLEGFVRQVGRALVGQVRRHHPDR
jgi:hypothetical protein